MNDLQQKRQPDLQSLPGITFRQLEIFRVVCHERSFANAALETGSTRAIVKRSCEELEKAVGRQLFEEAPDRTLKPTEFAEGLIAQAGPLSRGLRRFGESVKSLHEAGRILRFGAAGEFFRDGLFTDFLARLKIGDSFRKCFLRIEVAQFRTALLNAECDVYLGFGLASSDRMDLVDLGPVPWRIVTDGTPPAKPADLIDRWWIAEGGEPEMAVAMLEQFRAAGAQGGEVLTADLLATPRPDGVTFHPDTRSRVSGAIVDGWPCYRFTANLRKHHPYSELKPRLVGAAQP